MWVGLAALCLTVTVCLATPLAPAQDSEAGSDARGVSAAGRKSPYGDRLLEEDANRAIERGLDYLARRQGQDGRLSNRYSVAVTALGGMAFLGAGTEYKRGRHGGVLYDVVRYLTENAPRDPSGFIRDSEESPSRMHGHAYAVLFLAQVLGSVDTERARQQVRRVAAEGVRQILVSQTAAGGWGYLPTDQRDEASITVCCLQALRAAQDAGLHVPKPPIERAVSYLKRCCKSDGSFKYSLSGQYGSRSSYALTAAAVSTLDAAGMYTAEVHRLGVAFMMDHLSRYRRRPLDASENYPYYANLYVAQVFHQLGGSFWERWGPAASRQLLTRQSAQGNWVSDRFGDEYATAMACLILEVPRGYLPIFER